jgi:hypothetical protein
MFKLILTNGDEDYEISFKVRNTHIAKKWYSELCKNYELYETNRFTNWSYTNLIDELNENIKIINRYDYIIDKNLSSTPTQQELNYLHKFFEDLRGDIVKGTDWFRRAPDTVKHSVEQFNILIHQLEANIRTTNHPTVVVTFKDRPIFNLENDDLKHFTYCWTKGTVYINYCQVGKTVLDIFKDNDKITEGVRPQQYYSADFMIKFGPTIPYPVYLIRKAYIHLWLMFQRFKFKNLNLGMIPVADVTSEIDIDNLRKFNCVKGLVCLA